jgi:type IV pilus assembly protein PilP
MISRKGIPVLLFSVGILSGCGDQVDENVVEFVKAAKTQKIGHVEALPVFPPPQIMKYTAANLRDPFEPFVVSMAKEKTSLHEEAAPDLNRPREALEAYPLDSLKMVGTLEKEGEFFALIKDSNGMLYRVVVGNYLGQNSGKIEKITEKSIEVKEWLSDGKGGWREHWVTLNLVQ